MNCGADRLIGREHAMWASLRVFAGAVLIILCGIALQAHFFPPHDGDTAEMNPDRSLYPTEWLTKRITIEEAERRNLPSKEDRERSFELRKPFGYENARWESLKARMLPGDELWIFESPVESWQNLAGRAGIALMRDGRMIGALVTLEN
jgi:hypothetical protein